VKKIQLTTRWSGLGMQRQKIEMLRMGDPGNGVQERTPAAHLCLRPSTGSSQPLGFPVHLKVLPEYSRICV
jgi:hypothetical protein